VAVARTAPKHDGLKEIREAARLTVDALWAARRTIYIEAQYLTSSLVGAVLARKLRAADGPEVVIVVTRDSNGFIERWAMGTNRDRLLRKLRRADRHDRMRVVYPCFDGDPPQQILVHAKLIVVDDRFIRVGSSNLNNRSIALDTECDLAIEATARRDRDRIVEIRNALLAEHLDAEPARVAEIVAREGSLRAVVDGLNGSKRCLRAFEDVSDKGPTRPVFGTFFLDPKRPRPFLRFLTPRPKPKKSLLS
ncbi:MAG: phospholipase D-like domain-containing protein, partial [Flavobacteriaceae bacterium]